jgi:hypothetical protein
MNVPLTFCLLMSGILFKNGPVHSKSPSYTLLQSDVVNYMTSPPDHYSQYKGMLNYNILNT